MSMYFRGIMFLSAIMAAVPALGGVPNEIHHQGVIAVHGERFDGEGDFYFALVDELGYNLWTNDGTKIDPPSQERPDSPVTLAVVNGVYRVRLGHAPTVAIPRAVFNENDHVALRIWFTDGVNSAEPLHLTPDQVLTGVPYAQRLPNVFVDESSGNVGIGTTNPASKLEVQGEIRSVVGGYEFYMVPKGAIIMWSGAVADIPDAWALCNGENETPNLTDRFIVAAGADYEAGAFGGSDFQTHGLSISLGEAGGHSHIWSKYDTDGHDWYSYSHAGLETRICNWTDGISSEGSGDFPLSQPGSAPDTDWYTGYGGSHTHSVSATSDPQDNRPKYYALAYIMRL